jgi:HEAT repeat protein
MFAAWMGFIVFHMVKIGHNVNQHGSPAVGQAAGPIPAHVKYSPITDEDVERIQQLPAQKQAEELLERAIQHDLRALDLFEQNIESADWLGKIRLTDRMKELERRSEYSTDLRVRYANADLNLSMDGWQKTDEAAEKLIERARTDTQYRAAAVYFMGMMAGRRVAYDRLYPVLLEYAKHDPNESVRVWAVEGMRYLGTDEALDQLFDSFMNDPSNLVRDRAGCNLSDCGNFKRAQRMRMVPNFISLAQDPNITAQMRNWSFLALHEITDENVPNDVSAWQSWYDQHGSEKLVQFEQADWWQVRGDE